LLRRQGHIAFYRKAELFGHTGGASDHNDGPSGLREFLELRNGLLSGDSSEPTAELRWNAAGVGLTAHDARGAIGEHEHIELRFQIAGIERLRINHLERKLELFEQPACPA